MTTSSSASVAAGPRLPSRTLAAGAHLDPADGACLMELVSAVAGGPWSDEPACTHPLVAHVARLVNDHVSDEARQRLHVFVPQLAGAQSADPSVYPRVAFACTTYALEVGASPLLVHFRRAAERQLATQARASATGMSRPRWTWSSLSARGFRQGPAFRAVEASVNVCARGGGAERDDHLVGLFSVAVAAGDVGTRQRAGVVSPGTVSGLCTTA